jgi:eukaryotic-like serine/threonine-protein kinase
MKKCSECGREFPEQTAFCPFDGKRLDAPEMEIDKLIGTVLDGKYYVESKIGKGGMGNVYRAKHVHMETPVAVKILHPHLVSDQTTVERFRREARAAIAVNHPNAIHVMDFGVTADKTVYLVMEFLQGVSLRKVLSKEQPLPPRRAIEILKQVCAAVDAAHSKGIIHRDLKPDNILIINYQTPEEEIKVLDFSIAKLRSASDGGPVNLTQQGMVVGTPQYMSPEQAEGQELDSRSDLYSLGVILYEMLTGELPFKASTPMALILKHIHALPRPLHELQPDTPAALEAVVLRTLAKKRDDRPQTALSLADDLEYALTDTSENNKEDEPGVQSSASGSNMAVLNNWPTAGGAIPAKPFSIVKNTESGADTLALEATEDSKPLEFSAANSEQSSPITNNKPQPTMPVNANNTNLANWIGITILIVVVILIVYLTIF